jgi:protein SCO1/2
MNAWLFVTALSLAQASGHDLHATPGEPATVRPQELNGAGVEQKLGTQVPLDVTFRDETNKEIRLGDYLGKRPVVLQMAYFRCPMLCTQVMNSLFDSLPKSGLSPDQYELVIVSFDAREGPELAAAKREHYLEEYGRPGMASHVHFLTGSQGNIDRLSQAIGFSFSFDANSDQFAHPGMVTLLTPQGTIARYFFGIRFQPRDLRLGLVEASEGKIGSVVDSFVLYCLYYDPNGATYAASVLRIVRLGGVVMLLLMGAGFVWLRRRVGTALGAHRVCSKSQTVGNQSVAHPTNATKC